MGQSHVFVNFPNCVNSGVVESSCREGGAGRYEWLNAATISAIKNGNSVTTLWLTILMNDFTS